MATASIHPRFSLLGLLQYWFPDVFGTVPACPCCKINRLMRWIIRSLYTTPEAWKAWSSETAQFYEHQKYNVVLRLDTKTKQTWVSLDANRFYPGLYWNFRLVRAINKTAGAKIAGEVFGW